MKYILLNLTTTGFKYVNYCSFLYAIFTSSDKQEPEISIGTIKTKKNVFPMANVLPCVNLMFHVGDKKKEKLWWKYKYTQVYRRRLKYRTNSSVGTGLWKRICVSHITLLYRNLFRIYHEPSCVLSPLRTRTPFPFLILSWALCREPQSFLWNFTALTTYIYSLAICFHNHSSDSMWLVSLLRIHNLLTNRTGYDMKKKKSKRN